MPLDDRELEQISKALERGGTMLANHCEICSSPLFKIEGKVTCPVCTFRATQTDKQESGSSVQAKKKPVEITRSLSLSQWSTLDDVITELVANLASQARVETDLGRVQTQLECIERGLRIVRLFREIDACSNKKQPDK
ncbi:MAG TPA: Sjogren's syndrome/scleroderma autoantigen 1 family protein [Candidatus Acidoferrales bacterium]|jgi:UPF0148 protein|nr:Sjogren's syndrome/scleroderma autoantigen 1 family protein [Candidatus Acidoferrales bacterium]